MTDEPKTEPKPDPVPEQAHPVDPGVAALAKGKDEGGAGDDPAKLRKEAAGYRRRLRVAEQERDKLAARLVQADRAEVERQVTGDGGLRNADDFWLAVDLDDLRDEDGRLDTEKVKAARDRVLADRPHWRQPAPRFDGGAREQEPDTSSPSFGEALKNAVRG